MLQRLIVKLRCEPVAWWGAVLTAIIAVLGVVGVPADDLAIVATALSALGIPVVRQQVTPTGRTFTALTAERIGPPSPKGNGPVVHVELLPRTDSRLGRHIEHDVRSFAYDVEQLLDPTVALVSKRWTRRSPVLNQGKLRSCTANAAMGWVATDNATRPGVKVTEKKAVAFYELETTLDSIPGAYPPDDTGSTGIAAGKTLVRQGLASSYSHAFTLQAALAALSQLGPVLLGIPWHQDSFTPAADGRIPITGTVAGGHEIVADEIDVPNGRVWITNSWGSSWGVAGRGYFTYADLQSLLAAGGDVTIPHA